MDSTSASGSSAAEMLKPGEPVDVTNCDREPIHIPGRIQPYGVLLSLDSSGDGADLVVTQVSENAPEVFGTKDAPALLGRSLDALLGPEQAARLRDALLRPDATVEERPAYLFPLDVGGRKFDAAAHRAPGGELVLELEPVVVAAAVAAVAGTDIAPQSPDYYALVRRAMPRFHRARTITELGEAVVEEVRRVSAFDRVMLYRFDADGHGSVVAEARRDDLPPFLGLHYPASDIPQQARRLYLLNPLRIIADVNHAPAALVPPLSPTTGAPLDMSYCVLRSPSPIHIEYLKNMGVGATLTISIIDGGALWGLIACHHDTPWVVPFDVRAACEFLGQVTGLQLAGKQDGEDLAYRARLQSTEARLVEEMSGAERYQHALSGATGGPGLLDFVDAAGAAVLVDGECARLGAAPPEGFIRRLVAWLSENAAEDVWATDSLAARFPEAAEYAGVASGVLAISVTRAPDNYLLWFRPEVVQTVNWAGDPNKAVTAAADGSPRLSPRGSFALWKETVRGRSLPWSGVERDAARSLRRAIVEVVLKKAEQVAHLNTILARSNRELDDFAYIASHDLKEPLRGIHNYAHFLREDYAEVLDDEGRARLETLGRLTTRMEGLIDSLLAYSRFGRMELDRRECDLNATLADVREDLRVHLAESGAEVRVPRPLPAANCDPFQVGAIFSNLIANAAKYTDRPPGERWIEVGYRDAPPAPRTASGEPSAVPTVYYVRDNGIGIRERHFEAIFRLFKRLHGRDAYGGGTGAGLPIARKIAERHGGKLWLESEPGSGTTFYFTLAPGSDE